MIARALALVILLGACAEREAGPSFASEREAACYAQVQQGLGAGFALVRDPRGRWQEVLQRDSFVVSTRPSEGMVTCMADADIGPLPAQDQPLTLTPAQLELWETLDQETRAQAFARIQQGEAVDAVLASFNT
ncbi:MAG: hypothetical protein AAFR93_15435 [Pseudomonadota bacterium]